MDFAVALVAGTVIVLVAIARVLRPRPGYSLRVRIDLFRGAKKPAAPTPEGQDGGLESD